VDGLAVDVSGEETRTLRQLHGEVLAAGVSKERLRLGLCGAVGTDDGRQLQVPYQSREGRGAFVKRGAQTSWRTVLAEAIRTQHAAIIPGRCKVGNVVPIDRCQARSGRRGDFHGTTALEDEKAFASEGARNPNLRQHRTFTVNVWHFILDPELPATAPRPYEPNRVKPLWVLRDPLLDLSRTFDLYGRVLGELWQLERKFLDASVDDSKTQVTPDPHAAFGGEDMRDAAILTARGAMADDELDGRHVGFRAKRGDRPDS